VALQVVHYAPLDLVTPQPSKRTLNKTPLISAPLSAVFDASYTPDPSLRRDVRVSPAHPDNLSSLADLPPALVITAELDVLRDEGDRFAEALARAGVTTTHVVMRGVDHFYTHRLPIEPVIEALTCIAAHLRGALG
jgi:acetyl esterase